MQENAFYWLKDRAAGVLLHPTSLPGPYGIGTLSKSAYQFVDHLRDAEILYWQVLPLGPTGYGDSPYQAFSAFAGNPYLIDFEPLIEAGLLDFSDLSPLEHLPADHVDFGALYRKKWPILRLAFRRFKEQKRAYINNYGLFKDFVKAEESWLFPFSAFMALKNNFGGKFWGEWPESCRNLSSAQKTDHWEKTATDREAHQFFQYLFYGQWNQLREYANEQGVEIIGDIPIFVALDSADVWAHPEIFEMKQPGKPNFVAGVPPDYFSETGQLWGNPLYDWNHLKKTNYQWWLDRLSATFKLYDVVRLDHFRGFYDYWKIPGNSKDARTGSWVKGPQDDFFYAVHQAFPDCKIIAEDLGEMGPEVKDFRERLGFPGMAILHFAFSGDGTNEYLPHNLSRNCVCYPGSHDNNTTLGWYESASEDVRDQVRRYLGISGEDISWDLIRSAYRSVARLVIIPMQDYLVLDAHSRMNSPGIEQGNWQWRMTPADFEKAHASTPYLRELAWLYNR